MTLAQLVAALAGAREHYTIMLAGGHIVTGRIVSTDTTNNLLIVARRVRNEDRMTAVNLEAIAAVEEL